MYYKHSYEIKITIALQYTLFVYNNMLAYSKYLIICAEKGLNNY